MHRTILTKELKIRRSSVQLAHDNTIMEYDVPA